jgi:hypothetical protein
MPKLSEPTDFNDMAALAGLAAVAGVVAAAEPVDQPAQYDGSDWQPMSAEDLACYRDEPSPDDGDQVTNGAEQAWPEPQIPGVLKTPEVPCSILPGIWGTMAQSVSDCTQTPSAMSVMAALGVLATVLQGRFEVDLRTHREILAFWGLTVSASGTRKTAVSGEFQASLRNARAYRLA